MWDNILFSFICINKCNFAVLSLPPCISSGVTFRRIISFLDYIIPKFIRLTTIRRQIPDVVQFWTMSYNAVLCVPPPALILLYVAAPLKFSNFHSASRNWEVCSYHHLYRYLPDSRGLTRRITILSSQISIRASIYSWKVVTKSIKKVDCCCYMK